MPLQDGVVAPQGAEKRRVEIAPAGQRGIQGRAGMPFGEDKAVTFGPVGPCGIDPHDVKIQRGDDLHCGKRASGMAGSGVVDHRDDILADLNCLCFQAFHIL